MPAQAPAIVAARERGITVIGELELAWRLIPNTFIAVTGTNGKTTTTELLGHIHREAGLAYAVAGNVGTALASLVGAVAPDAVVVAECSSFQLEDTEAFAPEAAVLLNVEEDHLDRHGTFAAYREAKLRAFAHQGHDDLAVAPPDLVGLLPGAAQRVVVGKDVAERDGALRGAASACSVSTSSRCAAPTTRRTRWPPPRCASPAASIPTPCAPGCGRSPACPTASRR